MRTCFSVSIAMAGAGLLMGAAGAVTVQAKVVNKNSPTVIQVAPGDNTASATNSSNSTQYAGGYGATAVSSDNKAKLTNSTGMLQDVGTAPNNNGNSASASNSSGLTQYVGSANGNALFGTGVITVTSKDNEATLKASSRGTGNCGAQGSFFCGQFIGGGRDNEVTGSGFSNTQQIFFLGAGGGANGNELTASGTSITQFVTNNSGTSPITTIGTVGVRGANASHNDLEAGGSSITQVVGNGNHNDLDASGNGITEIVTNGSNNSVSVKGNNDTVTITGASPSMTADNNRVTVQGNSDTVTLTSSNNRVKIKGNGLSCGSSCTLP